MTLGNVEVLLYACDNALPHPGKRIPVEREDTRHGCTEFAGIFRRYHTPDVGRRDCFRHAADARNYGNAPGRHPFQKGKRQSSLRLENRITS